LTFIIIIILCIYENPINNYNNIWTIKEDFSKRMKNQNLDFG